jgi:GNAT superfamily N-acetyltransferase
VTDLEIRPATAADRAAIVALLATSLGRDPGDPRYDALFAWKHETNVFGPSPMWVACDGDRLAGFRTLMRWRFERDGRLVDAVRAVDTATHPDYQGHGIFTRLTLHALDALREEGVAFVFNTPNDQSRPGYLKMQWRVVGRVPVAVRPRTPAALVRMARSRTAADRWSAPCDAGEPASAVVGRTDELRALLASQPSSRGLRTARSPEFLAWRYGGDLLPYRCVVAPGGVDEGVAFFRRRARGPARETVVADVIVRGGDHRAARALARRTARDAGGEYAIRVAEPGAPVTGGFVRLPRQGPILTWRDVCETGMPPLRDWDVSLGDIELF